MPAFIDVAQRMLRLLPPETAHRLTLRALAAVPAALLNTDRPNDAILGTNVFGLDFPNPVGLAAGFDKNAEVFDPSLRLGFGFVEIGSVTPRPQAGNPRPRLFRLAGDGAVINRMGFNNDGLAAVASRLARRPASGNTRGILGANLGKNKDSIDAAADYAAGVRALGPHADYLVINVSSPNTPGLRALQGRAPLEALIAAVLEARGGRRPPLLLKIAPDLSEADKQDIAEVALAGGLDGLVVSNTTIARPASLKGLAAKETGGLSGRPLQRRSTAIINYLARATSGRLPIIGVGGIMDEGSAGEKLDAGATLVQLYTGLIYRGPFFAAEVARALAQRQRK